MSLSLPNYHSKGPVAKTWIWAKGGGLGRWHSLGSGCGSSLVTNLSLVFAPLSNWGLRNDHPNATRAAWICFSLTEGFK